jgi:Fis family transcriptional regulator
MTRAEPLNPTGIDTNLNDTNNDAPREIDQVQSLRDSVSIAIRHYLEELDGQMATDVYEMVLAEIEAPLLTEIMRYTRNNQTKASIMLGLNRGTLRKKLKQHKLISSKD